MGRTNEIPDPEPDQEEWPDPDTPPTDTASGEPGVTKEAHGRGQFEPGYEKVPEDVRDTGALPRDAEDERAT